MNWTTLLDAIAARVAAVVGIQVVWANQRVGLVDPIAGAIVRLHVLGVRSFGTLDEIRYLPGESNTLIHNNVCQRAFTVRCTVEVQKQGHPYAARTYLEALRVKLFWPPTVEAWGLLGLVLTEMGDMVDSDGKQDDRMVSRAYIDMQFAHAYELADTNSPVGTIGSVEVNGVTYEP